MKKYSTIALIALILLAYCFNACYRSESEIVKGRGIVCSEGMVVSAHPVASETGVKILQQGGNAYDAAAATAFALAVCYPTAGNIGGGALMVIRQSDGTYNALDCREKAPSLAHQDMYLDEEGGIINGMSTSTRASSGVPGSVAGIIKMHSEYGRLKLEVVIEPAVEIARKGFAITAKQAASLNRAKERFITRNDHPVPFIKDSLWKEGDILIQEELAGTLERIRDNGYDGFYAGKTADLIVREMEKGNGLISKSDLQDYKAVWRKPLTGTYSDYGIISMPPPSSGGVAILQLLGIMEMNSDMLSGFHNVQDMHLMIEAERRVYADRAHYLGDPDFVEIPVQEMINTDYLRERMSDYNPGEASLSDDISHGKINFSESEETTHFSVVDNERNAIAVTTTLNSGYGSCIVVEGAGFILNNEMDDFSAKPGHPNIYGLIGGKANSIQPGKRMLSSMTPTIIEKDDELYMVLGTPGGSTIITSVFQVIMNVIDYNMNMQEAVDAPRFHHQWMPDRVYFERERFDADLMQTLENMGHNPFVRSAIGRVDAIRVVENDKLEAGADSRGDDTACGY